MSEPVHQFFCANHPGFPTDAACADCGRPFCESCLTEMSGQHLCGWCRDQRLSRIQRSAVNPATVLLLARVFNGVSLVLTLGFAALYLGYLGFVTSAISSSPGASGGTDSSLGIMVAVFAVAAALSLILYLPPLIGLAPGRGWLWAWQMVTLCFSILGGCISISAIGLFLLVPAVVLLIYWIKPEVRDYCAFNA